jgi:hypothetical protein
MAVNGGYSRGSSNTTVSGLTPPAPPVTIPVSPNGGLGGVQLGYNWQGLGSPFLLGIETDFDGIGQSGAGTCTAYMCAQRGCPRRSVVWYNPGPVRVGA